MTTLKTGKIRREILKFKLDINFMTQQSAESFLIPKIKGARPWQIPPVQKNARAKLLKAALTMVAFVQWFVHT
ncbi:MAG: hypothetical protein ACJAWI_001471 [Marinomonas primoryensis]